MATWCDLILKEFTPDVARLTLVADPDGLLAEEGVLDGIRERGFDLIPFEDPVAFRFAYESKYRAVWDRGDATDLVVVLRTPRQDLDGLPYDLLQVGRKLSFNLGQLFPNLSYPVVDALNRTDLDALYEAQQKHGSDKLGDNGTKDFILRHVFQVAPELIKQPTDLLQLLLRRHYRGRQMPPVLEERLVQLLEADGQFDDWPLEQLISDPRALVEFLQERWAVFVDRMTGAAGAIHEHGDGYDLTYPGPVDIPFGHEDVRVYVDSLFLDGTLRPVAHEDADKLAGQWVQVGLRTDPEEDRLRRLDGLLKLVEGGVPAATARHQDWTAFALRWAELMALWRTFNESSQPNLLERVQGVQKGVDTAFLAWILAKYGGLHNLPADPPVMVHHIPRFLARRVLKQGGINKTVSSAKVALVVVDGLAFDQWAVLRGVLSEQHRDWRFSENGVFAWVPTLTSVSRQAIFAGRAPMFFPASIQTTDREPAQWSQYWADQGVLQGEVGYRKSLGDQKAEDLEEFISQSPARVLGLVVDKVDKIMHGMKLGAAGMHNQVRQWAEQGWLATLVEMLLDRGFGVYITSDHGNIE
ncbi:MAG: BREX-3 system phosphatase PglZ, partial [Chloroflexota bacterium]